jgi:hypothetical protein
VIGRRLKLLRPGHILQALLRARATAFGLAEGTRRPTQERDLYSLLSHLCALAGIASYDLGYLQAACGHARAAYTYARIIEEPTGLAFARVVQATLALWTGQPGRGIDFARSGLELRGRGTIAVRLHAIAARCCALRNGPDDAREAVGHLRQAAEAPGGAYDQLCDGIGGEFGFPPGRVAFSAAATYLTLGDANQAESAASRALELHKAAAQDADRWVGAEYGARADLAAARLLGGHLDGAAEALAPLAALAPPQRTVRLSRRAAGIRAQLAAPHYHGDRLASRINDILAAFIANSPILG